MATDVDSPIDPHAGAASPLIRGVQFRIASSRSAPAAIAIIDLIAESPDHLDAALTALDLAPLAIGAVSLVNMWGIDHGLAQRPGQSLVQLTPHGGPAVIREIAATLIRRGVRPLRDDGDASLSDRLLAAERAYPEARSPVDALALHCLTTAASPLATRLLLAQHERWRGHDPLAAPLNESTSTAQHDRALRHLLVPPVVLGIGPPNIGKSSLFNAMAGREVSIVADIPGTTRDHVGVLLRCDGLVIRAIDSPGFRETSDPIEAQAIRTSREAAANADLILLFADATAPETDLAPLGLAHIPALRVWLRSDLGAPAASFDVRTHAHAGTGLDQLARAIRTALVPDAALTSTHPWRFW